MKTQPASRILPWLVTAGLLAMALAAMLIWTRNIGIEEDWNMVGPWLGHEPDLGAWLWSQNNEHRLPLGRLIYLGLLRATDDFRSAMAVSQLLLAILSMLLIHVTAKARGGVYLVSDMLFPLALLNLGHWENLLWGWQIQFVSSTFLCGVLLAVVIHAPRPSLRGSIAAAVSLILLPLSGANGIAIALGMTPWAILAAVGPSKSDAADPRVRWMLLAGAAAAIAVTGIYFIGYVRPPWSPPPANALQLYHAAGAYFAMATGTWSRVAAGPVAAIVLLVSATGACFALAAFVRRFRFRDPRSFGLATFIGCNLLLGIVIAESRGALPYPLPGRYAVFAVMPFLTAIVALQLYAPARAARALSLMVAICYLLVLPLNVHSGFQWRNWYVAGMGKFEADIEARRPLPEIAERNTAFLLHSCDGCLVHHLRHLRDAGIPPFSRLPSDERHAPLTSNKR